MKGNIIYHPGGGCVIFFLSRFDVRFVDVKWQPGIRAIVSRAHAIPLKRRYEMVEYPAADDKRKWSARHEVSIINHCMQMSGAGIYARYTQQSFLTAKVLQARQTLWPTLYWFVRNVSRCLHYPFPFPRVLNHHP